MKVRLVLSFALCGLLALPVFAGSASKADFALRYAASLDLDAPTASDAVQALRDRGLVSPNFELSGSLTYGDLVDIFDRAGIDASTSVPGAEVETGVLDSVVSNLTPAFAPTTQAQSGDDDQRAPNNNGRKRRPKGQTPNSRANPNAFFGRDEG